MAEDMGFAFQAFGSRILGLGQQSLKKEQESNANTHLLREN